MNISVILVAGGQGKRFGAPAQKPKQFQSLLGHPLLFWPLKVFEKSPFVNHVVIVVPHVYVDWTKSFVRKKKLKKVFSVVSGGSERVDSVKNGFLAAPKESGIILIHDAARALVTCDVIERVVKGVRRTGTALAAWPVPDTLKKAGDSNTKKTQVKCTIPRQDLWLAQTPQGFKRSIAEKVLKKKGLFTDDVQMAEKAGYPVEIVLGASQNFKVTLPEDFKLCEAILKSQ